jgi:hypothetical protein
MVSFTPRTGHCSIGRAGLCPALHGGCPHCTYPGCQAVACAMYIAETCCIIILLLHCLSFILLLSVACVPADILPGQGLYPDQLNQTWRAVNCNSSNYGVANVTYGLAFRPCSLCFPGQVTSSNSTLFPNSASFFARHPDGSGGFVSGLACVNPPGYGFNGSAAEQCPKGSYNAADTYGNCTLCPGYPGFTTAGPGAGVTQSDCQNGNGTHCPIGEWCHAHRLADTRHQSCPLVLLSACMLTSPCQRMRAWASKIVDWQLRRLPAQAGANMCLARHML